MGGFCNKNALTLSRINHKAGRVLYNKSANGVQIVRINVLAN